MWSQSGKQWRHGFAVCGGCEDQPGTAKGLKCGNRVLGVTVNVVMCAELLRETFLADAARKTRYLCHDVTVFAGI